MSPASYVYQLKITLKYIKPPIWRRVQVPASITFAGLHDVIQVAMGWYDSHLHQFMVGNKYYGEPDDDMGFGGSRTYSEKSNRLNQVVPDEKSKFLYEYDFGDGWEHQILVEKIMPKPKGSQIPVCLAGKRNCPPEDCGGPPGYEGLLEALADPAHPEHEEYLDWLEGDFDPEYFDLEDTNSALAKL